MENTINPSPDNRIKELEAILAETEQRLIDSQDILETYSGIHQDFAGMKIDERFMENFITTVLKSVGKLMRMNIANLMIRRQEGKTYTPGKFFDLDSDQIVTCSAVGLTPETDAIVQNIVRYQKTEFCNIDPEDKNELFIAISTGRAFQSYYDPSPGGFLDQMVEAGIFSPDYYEQQELQYNKAASHGFLTPENEVYVTPEEFKQLYPTPESYVPAVCIPVLMHGKAIAVITVDAPMDRDPRAGTKGITEQKLADGERLANLLTLPLLWAEQMEEIHYWKSLNEAIVDSEAAGIAVIDADYRLERVNPVLSRAIGADECPRRMDIRGLKIFSSAIGGITSVVTGQEERYFLPNQAMTIGSRDVIYDISVSPVGALFGPATKFLIRFDDVTEAVYRSLAESEINSRMRTDDVASGLGHNLRTYLDIIRHSTLNSKKRLERFILVNPSLRELLAQDATLAEHITKLAESPEVVIRQLQTISGILSQLTETLHRGYVPSECTLSDIVREFEQKYKIHWPGGSLECDLRHDPILYIDPKKFVDIVLMELARNSQYEMDNKARMTLTAREGDLLRAQSEKLAEAGANYDIEKCLVIEVSDNGPGMTPEAASRAFNRFYSRKPETGDRMRGLGLYDLKKFVDASCGEVSLISELREGTTFKLIMPVIDKKNILINP
ncbi:HAMP domain-containing histidine kinase [Candidatus Woesearchaeota archaeon]|nr:HAMP domain-containing histidine kinase [Candidatus Woesearchaeota archaeon]